MVYGLTKSDFPPCPLIKLSLLHGSTKSQAKVKDEMLFDWSRESCIAAVEKESTKTASISGSKTGTGSGIRNHLTVNGAIFGGNDSDADSPTTAHHEGVKGESPSYGLI